MTPAYATSLPDLVERIGRIGDQLPKKDLFVGIESVDDEGHQLLDVRIEREGFRHGCNVVEEDVKKKRAFSEQTCRELFKHAIVCGSAKDSNLNNM